MIVYKADRGVATALRSAVPYIRLYRGETFVVKVDGSVFARAASTRSVLEQLAVLCYVGVRVVLVHGGATQLTRLPCPPWTGAEPAAARPADITSMVLNRIISNRILTVAGELEVAATAASAVAAGVLSPQTPLPACTPPGCTLSGAGRASDGRELHRLLQQHPLLVVSPQVADGSAALYSVDAHTLAAAVGAAVGAAKLILCSPAPGLLADAQDPGSLIPYTDRAGLNHLRDQGRLAPQLLPVADAIDSALCGGVQRVHLISQDAPQAILGEIFTNDGTGTLIVTDLADPSRRVKAAQTRRQPARPGSKRREPVAVR